MYHLVQRYLKELQESRRLIFIFPIWWADMPAIVKGYLDKVLLKTVAYRENKVGLLEGLLNLDEALVISTSTAPTFYLKYFCGNTIGRAMLGHTLKGVGAKKTALGQLRPRQPHQRREAAGVFRQP